MKNIATITFHWSANYGAALQAYALQQYLLSQSVQTQIIDYLPGRVMLSQTVAALKRRDFQFFKKRRQLRKFCKQHLRLTKRTYRNNRSLMRCADKFDAIICGSDQIWNESFTGGAEGKPTLSYFLNFAGERTKRIAYAVSFGTTKLSDRTKELITPCVRQFDRIGVRENSGKEILQELGVPSVVTIDPTLLLQPEDYQTLLSDRSFAPAKRVFTYILHQNQQTAQEICHLAQRHFGLAEEDGNELHIDLQQWLYELTNAEFVVTNSFHGAVFAVLFHKPFVVVPVERSGMNDRIGTLMASLELTDRIACDTQSAQACLAQSIDWDRTDANLAKLREASKLFLNDVIKE